MLNAKPKRRLLIAKNLIMMLVMAVCIVLAVSAWITSKSTASASGISIKTRQGGLDIAPCIKTYNADGTVKTDGPGVFTNGVVFNVPEDYGTFVKDCTGNGLELIVPEFNVTKDYESVRKFSGKEVNENLPSVDARSNLDAEQYVRQNPGEKAPEYQFLEFEFYVRSMGQTLELAPETHLIAETELNNQTLSVVPDGKKSEYGNFNVDGLVGAIRVSLVGEGCTSISQTWDDGSLVLSGTQAPNSARNAKENQLLWLPRPDVKLVIPSTEGDITNWTLSTGLTSGDTYQASYYVKHNTGVTKVENDQNAKISSGTVQERSVSVKSLGQAADISHFTYSNQLNPISLVVNGSIDTSDNTYVRAPYYVTKYTLRVWIEGTDAEARRAMDGGRFTLKLFFE